jgi:large subunit ribosomal protein L4
MPKKMRLLARRSALSARAGDDRVVLIDPLDFEKPSTRRLVQYLEGIAEDGKFLVLTDSVKTNVVLSARNAQEIRVLPFGEESTYDILWAHTVVIERTAIENGAGAKGGDEDGEEEAADA